MELNDNDAIQTKGSEMLPDLRHKRVVVTGAATGIGRSVAVQAAICGARLILADVNQRECTETLRQVSETGAEAFFVKTDVSNEVEVDSLFEEVESRFGGVDAVIHLAGVLEGASVPLQEFPTEVWDRVMAINVRGSFLVARAATRSMAGGGVIVLTSSGAGVLGGSSSFVYGTSKGAVHGLALVMQSRLNNDKIRVVDVLPGSVATPLKIAQVQTSHTAESQEGSVDDKIAQLANPEDVAKVFVWAISDSASAIRGSLRTT